MKRACAWLALSLLATAMAQSPETGGDVAAQSAADVLRDFARADGAFLAARNVNAKYDSGDLASLMQYPTDTIATVNLTGRDIRTALERSVALYPQPNPSFLQISGFSVEFSPSGAPNSRILNVSTASGSALDENRTYKIAMPLSLGRGGMGYFKIWDKSKITAETKETVEQVLRGKRAGSSPSRWRARS